MLDTEELNLLEEKRRLFRSSVLYFLVVLSFWLVHGLFALVVNTAFALLPSLMDHLNDDAVVGISIRVVIFVVTISICHCVLLMMLSWALFHTFKTQQDTSDKVLYWFRNGLIGLMAVMCLNAFADDLYILHLYQSSNILEPFALYDEPPWWSTLPAQIQPWISLFASRILLAAALWWMWRAYGDIRSIRLRGYAICVSAAYISWYAMIFIEYILNELGFDDGLGNLDLVVVDYAYAYFDDLLLLLLLIALSIPGIERFRAWVRFDETVEREAASELT